MRVTTAFKRLLRLDGVNVVGVDFLPALITVTIVLRRRWLICPHCAHKTRFRYDTRPVPSRWRHLDLGVWKVEVRATLRRMRCPTHGVVVEAVPFARPGAHLTRDYDDLLAWLATRMDKTAVARLCRVSWRTVGRACQRVVATELDPDRLDGLFRIGVDEISWRKHHKYLTLVVDHDRGVVVWGAEGKDSKTLDGFFDQQHPAGTDCHVGQVVVSGARSGDGRGHVQEGLIGAVGCVDLRRGDCGIARRPSRADLALAPVAALLLHEPQ